MRRWVYLVTGLIAAVIPIGVQAGVIDGGQAENSNTLLLSLASLLGAGGAVTAAHHTHRQIGEGLHDPPLSPIDQMQQSAAAVVAQANEAQQNLDRLREMTSTLNAGGLAEKAFNELQ